MMKLRILVRLGVVAGVFFAAFSFSARADETRPNVVFILIDSLGWSDTTLYGMTQFYQTPNIERIARRGMLFSKAYSDGPSDCPTRASILTGQNPARTGITGACSAGSGNFLKAELLAKSPPDEKISEVRSATRLDADYYTLSKAIKAAGYATGHFGKWYLGEGNSSAREYGFDDVFLRTNDPHNRQSEHSTTASPDDFDDIITDSAIKWMQKNKEKSFFLNYWPLSVGAPFHAKPELVEKYKAIANSSHKQYRPTYAAMIEAMDANIGKLLDAMDQLEIADKTAIIFFSTNGGVTSEMEKCDGGAPTSNSPLRGGAASVYEGGIAVPCIVSWPNVTKFNSRSDSVIQGADFYPTLVSLLSLKPKPNQIFDGVSIVPALVGKPLERRAVFTHFPHYPRLLSPSDPDALPPCTHVIAGEWKLIRIYHEGGQGKHGYRLYNLREDGAETKDLSAENSGKVAELDALIQKYLETTNAILPEINPDFKP